MTGSLHIFTYTEDGSTFRFGIDAGMFQTGEIMSEILLNNNVGFDPSTINAWILTHAHLDHCGRLPLMVKRGFSGPVYTTVETQELSLIVMYDAVTQMRNHYRKIEEEEYAIIQSGKLSTYNYERKDVELYNDSDVEKVRTQFVAQSVGKSFEICPGLEIEFFEASHILGSVFLSIRELKSGKVVFHSADLGFSPKPFLKNIIKNQPQEKIQAIIMESTYGDRIHTTLNPIEDLEEHIGSTLKKGGQVIIPAFALQRSQELLFYCSQLMRNGSIPKVQIFLDSPMAITATEMYTMHSQQARDTVSYKHIQQLPSSAQSKELNAISDPCIIIAGSGMMNGGRIWQHLRFHGNSTKNTLLIVGYQAEGTYGRQVMEGQKNFIINEKEIHLQCQVIKIDGFSGHADQAMLVKWMSDLLPQTVYRNKHTVQVLLVHGEEPARKALASIIQSKIPSLSVHLPLPAQEFTLFS